VSTTGGVHFTSEFHAVSSSVEVVWHRLINFVRLGLCLKDCVSFTKVDKVCVYMGVQKERMSAFLTAFEHREKEDWSLFAAQY